MRTQSTTPQGKIALSCLHCGGTFHRYPSQALGAKYCSRACRAQATPRVTMECPRCHRAFFRPPSVAAVSVYCSLDCRTRGRYPDSKPGRRASRGYVYLYRPDHPQASKAGFVAEHRLVVEEKLGRLLLDTEIVHHRNDVKGDNSAENLEVMDRAEHARIHNVLTQWARKHDCCVRCGTTDHRHMSHGLCSSCTYSVYRRGRVS